MVRAKPYDPAAFYAARRAANLPPEERSASEEMMPVYDPSGFSSDAKRRVNVFLQWRENGATAEQKRDAKSLSAHGVALMTLYARAHGVSGGRDVSVEDYIDQDFAPTINRDWADYFRALSRSNAHDTYMRIMGQVGFMSSRVLTGLCHDWFFGEGKPVERANGRREAPWRSVVRQIYRESGRHVATSNEESLAVWEALENLKHARW